MPRTPVFSVSLRQAWLKNVSVTMPRPSVICTSRIEPLRFFIDRSVTRSTSATIVTSSPTVSSVSAVSSPRFA